MSEWISAEIWIGGKVRASIVPELCRAIIDQAVMLEWGAGAFLPQGAADLLAACRENLQGQRTLGLCDDQARWGEFESLEAFLQEHEIPYTRQTDGKYEYEPERVEYRPETGMVRLPTNTAAKPVVEAERLKKVKEALDQAIDALESGYREKGTKLTLYARRALADVLPAEIPPLESWEIIQGKPEVVGRDDGQPPVTQA